VRDEERIVGTERVRGSDMGSLLPAAGVDRAGEPSLAVEGLHSLVEVPAELQEVEDLPEAVVVETVARRRGLLRAVAGYLRRHVLSLPLLATRYGAACRRAPGAPRRSPPTASDADGSAPPPPPEPPPSS